MSMFSKKRGFTLIELLVVIAIISLLASVVMASLNTARAKARDARRMQDIHQISNAIELYIAEYGSAPDSGSGEYINSTVEGNITPEWKNLGSLLSKYITLPVEPNYKANIGFGNYTYIQPTTLVGINVGLSPEDVSSSDYLLVVNRFETDKDQQWIRGSTHLNLTGFGSI